ncbi:MAG: T9SS type A sorting domain-containing protein [Chlorobi bacterium]|nr:T9SS type A sorting domain-containing protein [Chlorobiota bacterium]
MKNAIIILFVLLGELMYAQTIDFPKEFIGYRLYNTSNSEFDDGILLSGTKANNFDNESHGYGIVKKLDVNGNDLWEKLIGIVPPPAWSTTTNVTQTMDGGYVVVGWVRRVGTGLGTDVFVIKLNACGEMEWQRIFSSDEDQESLNIYEIEDGSFYFEINQWEMDVDPNKRIWVFKLDSNGNTLWKKYYADYDPWPGGGEMINEFIPDKNDDFVMSGWYYYQDPDGDSTMLWIRPLVIKIDTAGNEIWHNIMGINEYLVAYNLGAVADSLGSVFSSGQKFYPYQAIVNKVDSNGNTVFIKELPLSTKASAAYDISWLNDTTFYIIVGSQDSLEVVNHMVSYYLYKLDENASVIDSAFVTDSAVWYSPHTLVTNDNKIVLSDYELNIGPDNWSEIWKFKPNLEYDSTYTQPQVYDTMCPYPITNDTIPLDTTMVIRLEHLWETLKPMSIFPNPARDRLTISINIVKWQERLIKVTDLNGHEILSEAIAPGRAKHEVDISSWPPGIYVFSIFEQGVLLQTEKVVVY